MAGTAAFTRVDWSPGYVLIHAVSAAASHWPHDRPSDAKCLAVSLPSMDRLRVILAASMAGAALLSPSAGPWTADAQTADVPAERLAAGEWYQDARFGLFVHWGVYSLLGQGE